MRQRATAPWNGLNAVATRPSRPRTVSLENKTEGCIWPVGDATCERSPEDGLAVCGSHAKILTEGPDGFCAWPSCNQFATFKALCPYHEKRARGLLETLR